MSRSPQAARGRTQSPGARPATQGPRRNRTPAQELLIRDILADTEGVVRWGGDDKRPHEGLFYVNVRPGGPRLAQAAAKLRSWDAAPGRGAGVLVDMAQPARRRRAARYQ